MIVLEVTVSDISDIMDGVGSSCHTPRLEVGEVIQYGCQRTPREQRILLAHRAQDRPAGYFYVIDNNFIFIVCICLTAGARIPTSLRGPDILTYDKAGRRMEISIGGIWLCVVYQRNYLILSQY